MALALAPAPAKPPGYRLWRPKVKGAKAGPAGAELGAAGGAEAPTVAGGNKEGAGEIPAPAHVAPPPPLFQPLLVLQADDDATAAQVSASMLPLPLQPLQHTQPAHEQRGKREHSFLSCQAGAGPGEWIWLPSKSAAVAAAAVQADVARIDSMAKKPRKSWVGGSARRALQGSDRKRAAGAGRGRRRGGASCVVVGAGAAAVEDGAGSGTGTGTGAAGAGAGVSGGGDGGSLFSTLLPQTYQTPAAGLGVDGAGETSERVTASADADAVTEK